uniref:RNA recognition motif domain, nucleotide-binding alpha-beta plait domain protein n=1 Tax=Tanacetum cinerariifolium TaxID=118510 RepID=A0A6L2LYJ4_TANCI|nr:RNA recognition motif domain, nucleotide-binding alpha-beta plait domain protein [Tanacetum cinerariifolium]
MDCSLSHTVDKIKASAQKLMEEDIVHHQAIMNLAMQLGNASTTKDDMRKAYQDCNDNPQTNTNRLTSLIDLFGDENAIRIIPSPAGIPQAIKLCKTIETREGGHECVMSTQEYVRKIIRMRVRMIILRVAHSLAGSISKC